MLQILAIELTVFGTGLFFCAVLVVRKEELYGLQRGLAVLERPRSDIWRLYIMIVMRA